MKYLKHAIFIVPFLCFNFAYASDIEMNITVTTDGCHTNYSSVIPDTNSLNVNNAYGRYKGLPFDTSSLQGDIDSSFAISSLNGNCFSDSTDGNYWVQIKTASGDYYHAVSRVGGLWYSYNDPLNPATETRIVSMTPADGSVLPSATPVTFNAHLYINPKDVGNVIKLNISLRNIDQNVLLLGDFSSETYQMFFGVATTTGDWYYSTDILLADGNYRFNIEADSCVSAFGTCLIQVPFLGIHLYENTQFIVGTSTFIGNISQNSFAQTNSIFASTTATSTSALSRTCYPFSGNFDTIQCVSFLIIPDAGYLSDTLNNFRVNVSTHFPLGYITDLYGILSTTTQGTLEVVDVTLPMFGNPHIRLDLTNVLDPILNATTSQFFNGDISSSTETFYDVTSFYWDILVYVMTVFYIIGRILGSHLIPKIRL